MNSEDAKQHTIMSKRVYHILKTRTPKETSIKLHS